MLFLTCVIAIHFDDRVIVCNSHCDAVLSVIDSRDRGQRIIYGDVLEDRKIEVVRFREGAGYNVVVFDLQAGVGIGAVVPGQDGGVIVTVLSSRHVDADRVI